MVRHMIFNFAICLMLMQPCEVTAFQSRPEKAPDPVPSQTYSQIEDELMEGRLIDRWRDRRKRPDDDDQSNGRQDEEKRKPIWKRIEDNRDRRSENKDVRSENFTLASSRGWHVFLIGIAFVCVLALAFVLFGMIGLIRSAFTYLKSKMRSAL